MVDQLEMARKKESPGWLMEFYRAIKRRRCLSFFCELQEIQGGKRTGAGFRSSYNQGGKTETAAFPKPYSNCCRLVITCNQRKSTHSNALKELVGFAWFYFQCKQYQGRSSRKHQYNRQVSEISSQPKPKNTTHQCP